MQILMIAINDPAGTAIGFTKAINKYTDHSCRLITKEIRYNFMFEKDLHLPWLDEKGWAEVESSLEASDIFHFHMTADEDLELGHFKPRDFLKGKKILHHHHGHPDFRGNPDYFRIKYRRLERKAIVSTPDLLNLMPEACWQPNLVPINDALYLPPVCSDTEGPIRVCQAPTRKDLKDSDAFAVVLARLGERHTDLESVMIENTKHDECLRIKQSCQIHFDHMQGYFGVSSLESLSQGKPVIAGIDSWNEKHLKSFTEADSLPWVIARSEADLENRLETLIQDDEKRHEIGAEARTFMENYWTEKQILQPLIEVYESL